jgi:hypothetical protein
LMFLGTHKLSLIAYLTNRKWHVFHHRKYRRMWTTVNHYCYCQAQVVLV